MREEEARVSEGWAWSLLSEVQGPSLSLGGFLCPLSPISFSEDNFKRRLHVITQVDRAREDKQQLYCAGFEHGGTHTRRRANRWLQRGRGHRPDRHEMAAERKNTDMSW